MSEIEDTKTVDSSRRDFLKKSVAAGAVVWAAPVVTSLPGGAARAAPSPCPNPAGACTATAYGLQITAPIVGTITLPDATGGPPTHCVVNPTLPPTINLLATICGDVTSTAQACFARGYVEDLDLDILPLIGLPLLSVQATVLEAIAGTSGECPPCTTFSEGSTIAGLVINGGAINVTSPCNTVINIPGSSPLVTVRLNEQTCDANGRITVNALRINVPALGIQVIAGHAESARTGCTCVTC